MKKEAKYMHLFEAIKAEIVYGEYKSGSRIPGENELSKKYGMSRQTVRQSLALLEREGLVERKQGSGTYVTDSLPRRKHTWNVGVITTYISEYIFPSILRGMERELSQAGFSPMLSATANRVDSERRILEDYLKRPVDGLIVEATKSALPNPNIRLYEELIQQGVPIVFFNSCYPILSEQIFVVMNDKGGGYKAVTHLIEAGHTEIGGIFKGDDMQGLHRYSGFLEGALDHGLSIRDDRVIWFHSGNRQHLMTDESHWVEKSLQDCTAVVCYNDEVAVQLCNLLTARGYKVPQEKAVISFDSSLYSEVTPIFSLDHPKEILGAAAARKLVGMIGGKKEKSLVMEWGKGQ